MAHFIWHVMIEKHFSLPLTKVDIHFGHVRMYAMPYVTGTLETAHSRGISDEFMLRFEGF